MVLGILFLIFRNIYVKFAELEKLISRSYITTKTLFTISRIELINRREFAKILIDLNLETFVVYILALEAIKGIYSS